MSYYNFIKQKEKKFLRNETYYDNLYELLFSMFDYENAEGILYKRTLETALRCGGYAMTTKDDDGNLVTCPCSVAGVPDNNGEYIDFIGYTYNGHTYRRKRGEDCVIWQNNVLARPDSTVDWYAEMLTEIDTSIRNNVIFSRILPIPTASTNKMVEQIKEAQKTLENGELKIILDENLLGSSIEGIDNIKTVQLSDPEFSNKLQNLSMFHDDLVRRFATIYGHDFNGTPKKAQQSVEEISGNESFSHIVPMDNYLYRKKAVSEINEMYGTTLSIDFSPTWKTQLVEFLKPCDGADLEEHIEEPEEEPNEGADEGADGRAEGSDEGGADNE